MFVFDSGSVGNYWKNDYENLRGGVWKRGSHQVQDLKPSEVPVSIIYRSSRAADESHSAVKSPNVQSDSIFTAAAFVSFWSSFSEHHYPTPPRTDYVTLHSYADHLVPNTGKGECFSFRLPDPTLVPS